MNIESKKIVSFFKKIYGNGTGPSELKLNFGQTLTTSAINTEKTVLVEATMQPTEFVNYNPIGIMAIDDIKTLMTIIDSFGTVEIEKNDNLLTLKEKGKKAETILTNPEFIQEAPRKELVFDELIEIDAKIINKFIDSAKLNKDFILKMRTAPKQLILETDGKYKFTEVIEATQANGGIEIKVGAPFLGMIGEFDGKITLKLKNNYPIQIQEKTAGSIISATVAPYMDQPVEEKEE